MAVYRIQLSLIYLVALEQGYPTRSFKGPILSYHYVYCSHGRSHRGCGGAAPPKFGLSANLQQVFSFSANLQYTVRAGRYWNAKKAVTIGKFVLRKVFFVGI